MERSQFGPFDRPCWIGRGPVGGYRPGSGWLALHPCFYQGPVVLEEQSSRASRCLRMPWFSDHHQPQHPGIPER